MVRYVLYAAAALALAVVAIAAIGFVLPRNHIASHDALVKVPPAEVFAIVTDVAHYPDWRPDVSRVEIIENGPLRWREHSGGDVVTYEVTVRRPPSVLVVRIADPKLPFGGTWTYELTPEPGGTRVTITERGEVYNPIFRFMSRFVFSPTATIEQYLDALARRTDTAATQGGRSGP